MLSGSKRDSMQLHTPFWNINNWYRVWDSSETKWYLQSLRECGTKLEPRENYVHAERPALIALSWIPPQTQWTWGAGL